MAPMLTRGTSSVYTRTTTIRPVNSQRVEPAAAMSPSLPGDIPRTASVGRSGCCAASPAALFGRQPVPEPDAETSDALHAADALGDGLLGPSPSACRGIPYILNRCSS